MFYPNFTYTYFLRFITVVEREINSDINKTTYNDKFIKSWKQKSDQVRKSCKSDMEKKFGEASPKFFRKKLGRSSAARFSNMVSWLEQEKPELVKVWEKRKTQDLNWV